MREFPLEAIMADGSRVPIWPSRTIAAAPIGEDGTAIWFYDPEGVVQNIEMQDHRKHVFEALGIEALED